MAEKFPEMLRAAREQKSLSQTELAERAGLQPSAVSHFETGRRAPSFDNLRRLADALSVSIDQLIGRTTQGAVGGPTAQKLFRDFDKMTTSDQDSLLKMAEILAKKNKDRQREE
jgi:transcriptional regulator with XRE-family HTH domain